MSSLMTSVITKCQKFIPICQRILTSMGKSKGLTMISCFSLESAFDFTKKGQSLDPDAFHAEFSQYVEDSLKRALIYMDSGYHVFSWEIDVGKETWYM